MNSRTWRERTFTGDQLAFAEFPLRFLLLELDVVVAAGRSCMKTSVYLKRGLVGMTLVPVWFVSAAHAEMASVYGGRDGFCGSRTANGERVNCSAMTAAHRRLPFGTRVRVVTADASRFALTIVAPLSGVGISIYRQRRPGL